MPGKRREHYAGDYTARAAAIRRTIHAGTPCGICGRTLDQHRAGDTWDIDHVIPGNPNSALRPAAASCNRSKGATEGNLRRAGVVSSQRL